MGGGVLQKDGDNAPYNVDIIKKNGTVMTIGTIDSSGNCKVTSNIPETLDAVRKCTLKILQSISFNNTYMWVTSFNGVYGFINPDDVQNKIRYQILGKELHRKFTYYFVFQEGITPKFLIYISLKINHSSDAFGHGLPDLDLTKLIHSFTKLIDQKIIDKEFLLDGILTNYTNVDNYFL